MKKTQKNSSSGASLVMGKYTYHRKRQPQKDLSSSQRVAADKSGLGDKQVDKLKKRVFRDSNEPAEVETAPVKPETTKLKKRKKEKSANGKPLAVISKSNLHSKQSSLKKAANQNVSNLSRTVRGVSLFFSYMDSKFIIAILFKNNRLCFFSSCRWC